MILPGSPCVDPASQVHRRGWIGRSVANLAGVAGMLLYLGCSTPTPEDLSIAGASALVIYEGLPHPTMETQSFQTERLGPKPTFERSGSWFYTDRLVIPAAETAALQQTLGNPRDYQKFSGEKKCGGFHPDYAVEWTEASVTRTALICFTCDEIKVVGPAGDHHYDLDRSAVQRLHDLLYPHRRNRPDPR